jgi:hypothetical protein
VGHRARGLLRDGDCWNYFPHDHARSRAYRWGEDGLLGLRPPVPAVLRAGAVERRDPILKERLFGLPGRRATTARTSRRSTTTSTPRRPRRTCEALYKYPQAAFPYERCCARTARAAARARVRTGRHRRLRRATATSTSWRHLREGRAGRLCSSASTVDNRGFARALHVLPQLWFRNTWSWGRNTGEGYWPRGVITIADGRPPPARARADSAADGARTRRRAGVAPPECWRPRTTPTSKRLYGTGESAAYPKDAFHDAVVHGRNRLRSTRRDARHASARSTACSVPAGGVRLRLCAESPRRPTARSRSAPVRRGLRGAAAEATPSTRAPDRPDADAERRVAAPGLRRPALEQAVLLVRRAHVARRRPGPAAAAATAGSRGRNADWRTSTTATSSRCPTSGSTRGTPRGTSPST